MSASASALTPARPRIQVLPDDVKSRIAAGEVIERPASVLKELVENSLDAGARNIHVALEGGGIELLRVADDGWGLDQDDLALAVLRHATSKLTSAGDLHALTTLGFRGEALPAIGSVSHLTLTSRPRGSDGAWRLQVDGGTSGTPAPASGAPGTVVEARELFYNLPARRKFLKGLASEAAACADTLLRLALVRPDVAFTLAQGRQEILNCPACAEGLVAPPPGAPRASGPGAYLARRFPLEAYAARACQALGRLAAEGLVPVTFSQEVTLAAAAAPAEYRLFGLLTPPAVTRPNRSSIYLAVNGRPVRDRTLTSALLEAHRHLLPAQRYPAAVLFLELPGTEVDVNVHPAKAEVRFRAAGLIFSLFYHLVRTAFGPVAAPGVPAAEHPAASGPVPPDDWRLTVPPAQKAFDLWLGERTAPVSALAEAPVPFAAARGGSPAAQAGPAPAVAAPLRSEAASSPAVNEPPRVSAASPAPRQAAVPAAGPFRVLGQAGGAYIVLEDDEGLKLLDQHALHERVLFEELLARAQAGARGDRQGLLLPETLELTPAQAAAWADPEAREVLSELGYEVAEFGPRAVAVQAVPAVLKSARAGAFVGEVLEACAALAEDLPSGRKLPSRASLRERAAKVLACRGAVKAGERLAQAQMEALVGEFRRRAGPAGCTCPHGRPIAFELTWEELDRRVGRS